MFSCYNDTTFMAISYRPMVVHLITRYTGIMLNSYYVRQVTMIHISYVDAQMIQEIEIHRSVNHKHIVGFHGYFEDVDNVYIVLELCRRRVSYFQS